MFVLGHLGIGETLATPWRARLSNLAVLTGALLPDLIDKPLYYARFSEFFSCTRTIGHSGVLVLTLAIVAFARRSPTVAALALGMATHVIVDCVVDFGWQSSAVLAAAWPLLGPFEHIERSLVEHVGTLVSPVTVVGEVLGFALLYWHRRGLTSARPARSIAGPQPAHRAPTRAPQAPEPPARPE